MNYQELCLQVAALSKEAGSFIRKERENFDVSLVTDKGVHMLVSYVDVNAEKILVEGLTKLLPGSGFITEENTIDKQHPEFTWIIDPLDGTTNFIHGLPVFSVSVALLQNNETVIGVVYEVMKDECFYAWKNGDAFLNGEKINVSKVPTLHQSLLATGFPYYDFGKMDEYLALLRDFMKITHGLRRLGSAAVDLAYVACGRFDGFFEYGLQAWDVAGGAFILQRAGGKVTDFNGGDNYLFGNEMVASSPSIFNEFLSTIQNHFKPNA